MPVPVEELTSDNPFSIRPDTNEYEALSFLVAHHEYGFTPREIAVRTVLSEAAASNTLARLFENGVVERTDSIYYIDPHQVDELTYRLKSLDSLVTLFEVTPDGDSYDEEDWEQEVSSVDPDSEPNNKNNQSTKSVEARAEALIEDIENSHSET